MAHTLDLRTGTLTFARHQRGTAEARGFHLGKLDFTRISAEAGAIAINAAALLLLLAPLSAPMPIADRRPDDIIVIPVTPKKPPDPYVAPKKVEVTKPRTTSTTPAAVQQKIEPPETIVEAQPGDIPVDPVQVAKTDLGRSEAITEPLPGAHLEYEVAPSPPYPVEAIRGGLTGMVTLRVLVDVDGKPIDVQIEHSSGHRVLDAAARKQVLAKWRFKPATQDGQVMQAIGLVPIVFNLNQ
jgi:protein TonB